MEKCPAQAAQEKPQLLIFLRPKDISGKNTTRPHINRYPFKVHKVCNKGKNCGNI